jgi:hypothetical protein
MSLGAGSGSSKGSEEKGSELSTGLSIVSSTEGDVGLAGRAGAMSPISCSIHAPW